jgi:flagellar biosynthesis chaperone FliJ
MSFNKLDSLFDMLQNEINDSQSDVSKFVEGNNSAGTRVRKAMQNVKTLAQQVRVEIQDQKNSQF